MRGDDDDDDDDDDGRVETCVTCDNSPAANAPPPSPTHVAQSKHLLQTRTRCNCRRHFSMVMSRDMRACDFMSIDTCVKFVDEIMAGISDRSLN